MYLAYTVTHAPEEAPARYVDLYPKKWVAGRRVYAGMASALDESVGNLTASLKALGMWDNTLLVFSSDNGGPSLVGGPSFANNYPLRGGKGNDFEGGARVLGCVSGGLVPASQFGRSLPSRGHIHVADWCAGCQFGQATAYVYYFVWLLLVSNYSIAVNWSEKVC